MYVEKKNEEGYWIPVAGRNPLIDDYKMYAKNARERGDIERAKLLEKESKDIESGAKQKESMERYGEMDDYYAPKRYVDWIWGGRNYNLFGVLAGVRSSDVPQIDEPRGLPEDASPYVEKESNYWGWDGHSHSYLTLRDIKEFDWEQGLTDSGWVTEDVYKQFKEAGDPYPCCEWAGGPNVVMLDSNDEMDDIISGKAKRNPEAKYYTKIRWTYPIKQFAGHFYDYTIPELEKLSEDSNGEDVRLIFWFDN